MGRPKKEVRKNETPININLIKEFVNILSKTDKKVRFLNDCSKKDFTSQNTLLKQHYNEVKSISDNSNIIGDILSKSNSKNLSFEISDFQSFISSKSESLNKRLKNHLKLLEEIKTKISQLHLPLQHYKQNAETLKSLITNLQKNFVILKNNNNMEDPNIFAVEELIIKMKTIFPLIDDSLLKLNALSESVINDLSIINKKNLENFSNLLYKLSLNNMEIIGIVDEKTSQMPGLKDTAEQCINCLNKILSDLQYQDIINQKIEHINNIHSKIISELNAAESTNDFNIDLSNYKLSSHISNVVELQVAQLIYTNLEYKNAIDRIKNKFAETADNMNTFAETINIFSKKYKRLDKALMNDLTERLSEYSNAYDEFSKFKKNYAKDLKSIDKLSDDIYGFFTTLNSINASIEQLTFKIVKKHFSSRDQKDVFSFAKQIETISSENNKELHSIQYIYANIQKNSKFLLLSIDNTRGDVLMVKRGNEFLESININFNEISKEFPLINKLLEKNTILSSSISKEILPPVDTNNYFDLYNKTIEELMLDLNHIYKQLRSENIDINQFKRDLTMKHKGNGSLSSKLLQNRTLNKLKGKNYINNNLFIKNKKDNDVEIF